MYEIYEDSESDDVGSINQCIVCLFQLQYLESRKPISSILDKEFQGNIKPNVVVSVGYFRDQGGNFQFSSFSSPTVQEKKFDVINEAVIPHNKKMWQLPVLNFLLLTISMTLQHVTWKQSRVISLASFIFYAHNFKYVGMVSWIVCFYAFKFFQYFVHSMMDASFNQIINFWIGYIGSFPIFEKNF